MESKKASPVHIVSVCTDLKTQYPELFGNIEQASCMCLPINDPPQDICSSIVSRVKAINAQICATIALAECDFGTGCSMERLYVFLALAAQDLQHLSQPTVWRMAVHMYTYKTTSFQCPIA